MGGQACVFYGAAQVSKDIDLVVYAEEGNYERLRRSLKELRAERIAVPRFDPNLLARGHAVHFRCQGAGVENLRIDIMTKLRGLADFETLWERRTVFQDDQDVQYHLLSVPDLVIAKKTQRTKDWPIIELLIAIHYRENKASPTPMWIQFWLLESRTPEILVELVEAYSNDAVTLESRRPLLAIARQRSLPELRTALDVEMRTEQALDREYWGPLKKELEQFRFDEIDRRES